MRNALTAAEYEALTARLFSQLPKVNSADSLLLTVSTLLEAEVVVLVGLDPSGQEGAKVLSTYPADMGEWAAGNLDEVRWWVGLMEPEADWPGFQNEKPLQVGDLNFADSLVAFGGILPRSQPSNHEMILLQTNSAKYRYSTYHPAIAATLLRHYELIAANQALLNVERKERKIVASLLTLDALVECDWDEFDDNVKTRAPEKYKQPDFMGSAAVLATAYSRWHRRKFPDEAPDRKPLKWLLKRRHNISDWSPNIKLTEFLLANQPLDDQLAAITLNIYNSSDEAWKAAIVVLEHGWRLVREAASNESDAPPELPGIDHCKALLSLTSALTADELVRLGTCDKTGAEIGRDSLRIYLANLLCGAKRLRRRCLWIDGPGEDDTRHVAAEVRREFLLNLARFMLGVVEILERRSQVVAAPQAVSKVEVLDGLLYMVDRFAHVELGVDERIHIRENLGRGVVSEVSRHINQRFYRDHLIHVIDVFLIGHLLLCTRINWVDDEKLRLVDQMATLVPQGASEGVRPLSADDKLLCDWTISALLHDIGYQITRSPQTLVDDDAADQFFALPRPASLEWVDACRSRDLSWNERLERMIAGFGQCSQSRFLPDQGNYDLDDHGILSALRVAQVLAHAGSEGQIQAEGTDLPLVLEYDQALHAIAHHNLFNHEVRFVTHPLSCLLRLCDELQEWGRRRVNIEHIVKHLYIQIEQENVEAIEGHESLECLGANLRFDLVQFGDYFEVTTHVEGNHPILHFWMVYRDPVKAQYDAITTLLSKAYNLQHIDFGTQGQKTPIGLEWRLLLRFPRPVEYRGLTELDIYGILRERVRVLPELRKYETSDAAPTGLVWLSAEPTLDKLADTDCIAIIVRSPTDTRRGRQTCHPDQLRSQLLDIKKELLTRRALGPEQQLLDAFQG